MSTFARLSGVVVMLAAGLLGVVPGAEAQFNFNPNMNPGLVSGLSQAQYMALLQQQAGARAAVQAQALFPATGGVAGVNPYTPVTTNPYSPGLPNPYSPVNPYVSPYDQAYYNPYMPYVDPGSVLRGAADMMRAYGTVITSQ